MDHRLPPTDDDLNNALDLDDEVWDVLVPEDDYEPVPEPGDFWIEPDA